MEKPVFTCPVLVLALSLVAGCAGAHREALTILGGEPVLYECENGNRIEARYYTLSDRSLGFVKLKMPDGRTYTLPNLVSASGARFTDERELVWWIKGDSAFVETRDENGEFQITLRGCHVVRKGKD